MRHTRARALAIVAIALLLASAASAGQDKSKGGKDNPGTGPDKSGTKPNKYNGLSYAEWSVAWWQAVLAVPRQLNGWHPLLAGGAFGGNNGMVFLSAPIKNVGSVTWFPPITIPAGTHLFVPVITFECSVAEQAPLHGENEAELRACANGRLDLASDLYAEIDGTPVKDIGGYRVESPLFRWGPLPDLNVLKLEPGTQSDAVAAGYYLLLQPFTAGEHRIVIRANVPEARLNVDTEFIVTVEPPDHQK